jgi:hypothetical protein
MSASPSPLPPAARQRIDGYLAGVREARDLAEELGDGDTVDLLTQIATEFEQNAGSCGPPARTPEAPPGPGPG